MITREELEADVQHARNMLADAERELADFDSAPENNVFGTLDAALRFIEDKLLSQAHEDCEGSYNCGADEYTQEFYVEDTLYVGTLKCEYNRHDKTFYYVDGSDFTYEQKP